MSVTTTYPAVPSTDSSLVSIEPTSPAYFWESVKLVLRLIEPYYILPLIVIGVAGNITSLVLFFQKKLRFEQLNCMLIALAISNCGFLFTLLVVSLKYFYVDPFNRFDFICKLNVYLTYVFSFLSVWIIVASSIERVRIVYFRLNRFKTRRVNVCTIIAMVLISLLIYTIVFKTTGVVLHATTTKNSEGQAVVDYEYACVTYENWFGLMKLVGLIDVVLTVIIPFGIIFLSNLLIIIKLKEFKNPFKDSSSSNSSFTSLTKNRRGSNNRTQSTVTDDKLVQTSLIERNMSPLHPCFESEHLIAPLANQLGRKSAECMHANSARNLYDAYSNGQQMANRRTTFNGYKSNSANDLKPYASEKHFNGTRLTKNSYTVVNNLGFAFTVKRAKPSLLPLNRKLHSNWTIPVDSHSPKKRKTEKLSLSVNFNSFRAPNRAMTMPPPGLNHKEYKEVNKKNSLSLDLGLNSMSESMRLKRRRIYTRTTKTLLVISCTFLLLNTPIAISKIRYFIDTVTAAPPAAFPSMLTTTKPLSEYSSLYNSRADQLPGLSSFNKDANLNATRSVLVSSAEARQTVETFTQSSNVLVDLNLIEANINDEIIERVSCYAYYLHFAINFLFYLINYKKFKQLFVFKLHKR